MTPLIVEIKPCPGCGLEPEIQAYYRRGDDRVGFHCTCGAIVIDGIVVDFSMM